MYIEVFAGEQRIGSGTGFILDSPDGRMLVSNRHVIVGRKPGSNQYQDPGGRQPTSLRIWSINRLVQPAAVDVPLFDADMTEQWVEHPDHRNELDLVGIPWHHGLFESTSMEPYMAGGAPAQIAVPDPVLLLGFPLRFNGGVQGLPVAVTGMIATTPGLPIDGKLPRFLIDSATREGLSGAPVLFYPNGQPVVNVNGTTAVAQGKSGYQLLGIYTGRIREDAQLGYVITAAAIRRLLEEPRPGRLMPV
jgi:S1-C subfamily serine protease